MLSKDLTNHFHFTYNFLKTAFRRVQGKADMAQKERNRLSGKIDNIFSSIFSPEDGRSKSAVLLYSFCLSLLFIVVFVAAYLILVDPLETMFQAGSEAVRNMVEYTFPAIAACIPCLALSFAFKRDKMSIVPLAFIWICVITLIMCVTMAFAADKSNWRIEYGLFLKLIGLPMIISAVLGTIGSQIIFRIRNKA